ncbi:MAG: PCYCGC domain-containing protein [Candidatus Binatia bacterium]|nr:PCYCGC domain-containing protein [Candidatus Binatia bacterium]
MRKFLCSVGLCLLLLVAFSRIELPAQTQPTAPAVANIPPAPDPLPTPLPAERFTGRIREAYQAAADIPEVLATLHCYCGCDKSLGHRSLLDCFVDDHGAG